jgi:hypothetical protein
MELRRRWIYSRRACASTSRLNRCGFHWRNESISPPRERLDVARTGRRISQGFPQLVHGRIQAVIEIHEGVSGPQFLAHLLASDQVTAALQQEDEHLKRLFLEPKLRAVLAKLSGRVVELKHSEPRDSAGLVA